MATLQDIADHLNIAKGTVSKALNDAPDVSEGLKKQVCEAAIDLGYVRQHRKADEVRKLCVLIEHMEYKNRYDFGRDIIIGFRQMAEPNGYDVDIIPLTDEIQQESSFDVFMLKYRYEGAFFLGYSIYDAWYEGFKTSKTPAVFFDNYIHSNPRVAFVGVDNRDGLNQAVTHLKEKGHTRIGYLTTKIDAYYTNSRYQAFLSAMENNGLTADSGLIRIQNPVAGLVEKGLPELISRGATAVICSYDEIAIAVLHKCKELGVKVPNQLSVIGFDDIQLAQRVSPALTTLRQDRIQLGKSGYYALSCLINQVSISTLLLHPDLILRDT